MPLRFVLASLCLVFLFLSPMRANAQSYSGTSTSMAYGMYNGSSSLAIFSEWFYLNSGSGSYQWGGNAVQFSVTITKYTSQENLTNNNPASTNTTLVSCGTGEWAVQQWNPTTARVSGTKYIPLEDGYISVVSITPYANGNYRTSFYQPYQGFTWNGQQSNATIDLLWPPDG